ncbi:uncharacterized protein [Euphorbia lathyris]
MEDQGLEWENNEHGENGGNMEWMWNKGLSVGKKMLITGVVISSAPVILPPLMVISTLGLVCAVPYGLFLATYACTEKLITTLVPSPNPVPLTFEELGAKDVSDEYGGDVDMANEEEELRRRVDLRLEQDEKANEEEELSRRVDLRLEQDEKGNYEEGVNGKDEVVEKNGYVEDDEAKEDEKPSEEIRGVMIVIEGEEENGSVVREEVSFEVTDVAVELCQRDDDSKANEELVKETTGLLEKIRDEGMSGGGAGEEEQSAKGGAGEEERSSKEEEQEEEQSVKGGVGEEEQSSKEEEQEEEQSVKGGAGEEEQSAKGRTGEDEQSEGGATGEDEQSAKGGADEDEQSAKGGAGEDEHSGEDEQNAKGVTAGDEQSVKGGAGGDEQSAKGGAGEDEQSAKGGTGEDEQSEKGGHGGAEQGLKEADRNGQETVTQLGNGNGGSAEKTRANHVKQNHEVGNVDAREIADESGINLLDDDKKADPSDYAIPEESKKPSLKNIDFLEVTVPSNVNPPGSGGVASNE